MLLWLLIFNYRYCNFIKLIKTFSITKLLNNIYYYIFNTRYDLLVLIFISFLILNIFKTNSILSILYNFLKVASSFFLKTI